MVQSEAFLGKTLRPSWLDLGEFCTLPQANWGTLPYVYTLIVSALLKTLFVIKSDIICLSCKVCKFPKNSMDENYMHPEINDQAPKVL